MRTRKEHLFSEETIYHINYGVIHRLQALRNAVTTHVEKYEIFSRVLISPIGWWHVTCLYSVRLMNERQSLHHSQSKIVCRNFFGLWLIEHWKIVIAYRQWRSNFPRRERRKTESYVFSGFGNGIRAAETKIEDGRLATGRFWPRTLKISSVGKDQFSEYIISLYLLFILKPRSQKKISWDSYHLSMEGGEGGKVGAFWLCRDKMTSVVFLCFLLIDR